MLTDEQLAMRRTGVTSTDASAILGINPYKSALEVYADKVMGESAFAGNEATWWGNHLEGVVAQRYQLAMGKQYLLVRNSETIRSVALPWMLATPDGIVYDDKQDDNMWGFEAKTAMSSAQADRWGGTSVGLPPPDAGPDYYEAVQRIAEANGDRVPHEYLVQCVWAMEVWALPRWDLAVLIAGYHGAEFRIYTIKREKVQKLINATVQRCWEFWQNVEKRIPPDPDGSDSAMSALRLLHPQREDAVIDLATDDQAEMLADYAVVDAEFKKANAEREVRKQELIAEIGESEGIETADGAYRATWKARSDGVRVWRFKGE